MRRGGQSTFTYDDVRRRRVDLRVPIEYLRAIRFTSNTRMPESRLSMQSNDQRTRRRSQLSTKADASLSRLARPLVNAHPFLDRNTYRYCTRTPKEKKYRSYLKVGIIWDSVKVITMAKKKKERNLNINS